MEASHKERTAIIGKQSVDIKAGQFPTGRFELAAKYNEGLKPKDRVSEITVWRWLKLLEASDFLIIESNTKFSLCTVVNWTEYQENDQQNDHVNDQQMINKRSTNDQPMITNKNVKNYKNDKEEKIKPSSSQNSNKYSEDNDYYQMSIYLFNKIKTAKTDVNPKLNVKEPNYQKWSNDFRLIVENDNRDKSELKRLIDWIYTDSFWKSNIESPAKLREKYERLVVKMDSKPASNSRGMSRKDEFHEMLDNMMRMEDDPTVIDITDDAYEAQKNLSRGELF
jgi:hypothetical protein